MAFDLTTPAGRLADAQDKLHRLRTGQLAVEVAVKGRLVRFYRTDEDSLIAYIRVLEGVVSGCSPRFGAVGFII